MTIEVPPIATPAVVENTAAAKNVAADATKEAQEPTMSIQIEPPTANNPEDLATPNEEKPTSAKRKPLFNNLFKVNKKEAAAETPAHTADISREIANAEEKVAAAVVTAENKIAKGLGNLYTRIKQTASNNNIKDIAGTSSEQSATEDKEASVAAVVTSEEKKTTSSSSSSSSSSSEGDAAVHEAETPSASANHSNTNKRQSLLSKLFGGAAKKKEEEHSDTEHNSREVNTTQESETPSAAVVDPELEEHPSSPTLSRRVTGFFAKKIPSYNKKHQKSNDKAETAADEHANSSKDANEGGAAIVAQETSASPDITSAPAAAATDAATDAATTAATGVTATETITNKDASPATPVVTSA
ncbi:hypothetical protein BD408DRAFT_420962 [Parasitella parasitica]|nr:hypothetical protein BD408DRAFT_420962 [Parasitella parasitica]